MRGFLLSMPVPCRWPPLDSSATNRAPEFGGLSWEKKTGKERCLSGGKDRSVGLLSVVLRCLKNGALFCQLIKKED